MKYYMKIVGIITIYSFLFFVPISLLAQDNHFEELIIIEKTIRKESIALKALIKKVHPDYSNALKSKTISILKISSGQCQVRETRERSSQIIYSPAVNEEFKIIKHEDNYYHIQINGNLDGWIHETCGQVLTESIEKKPVLSMLSDLDLNKYLDFSEMIFSRIEDNKKLADRIIDKNKIDKKNDVFKSIENYYSLANEIYKKYLKDRTAYIAENFSLEKRFSGSSELLLGGSNHYQNYLDGSKIEYDEIGREYKILGNYIFNKSSKARIMFGNKREVLGTPYKTSNYGVGYCYTNIDKLLLNTNINFNSYEDDILSNNDYGRFKFNTNVKHQLSSGNLFQYGYSFMKNNFDIGDERDYSSHKLSAIADLEVSNMSKFVLSVLANFENSDSDFHNFTSLLPSLSFQSKDGDKRKNVNFRYENIVYENLELLDYNRLLLSYLGNNSYINKRTTTDLAFSIKSFPNNDIGDYYQIKTRFASSIIGGKNKRKSFTLFTNLYPNAENSNFTDLRFDSNTMSDLSANFSIYYRLWHDIFTNTDGSIMTDKPSVLDLSSKFGFKIGHIFIGPSFGLHAILDFESDEIIERDGNLIRVGGVVEGPIISSSNFNATIMAAYDYGFVYDTSELLGELEGRHPTTIKVTSTISAPIVRNIELIGRINYYKINTDMDEKISVNPIEFTSRMSFQLGIRYRYN